jgi:hypothetical protein
MCSNEEGGSSLCFFTVVIVGAQGSKMIDRKE